MPEDSIFRAEMERENMSRLSVKNKPVISENLHFYPPLKGEIISAFDVKTKHFGVDIKVGISPIVKATLDGMVIFSGWTLSDHYVVQIQHSNNLISIYKGNSTVFKSAGERVSAGDVIATTGAIADGTKENTLHFELWQNGIPIDPTIYIQF
jgi:murein DD-endopeptidase MepM/ murein hydrolase activator NlpD